MIRFYDYYIQRGAPSYFAFRKVQELYADFVLKKQYDKAVAVLEKYEGLFPNFSDETFTQDSEIEINSIVKYLSSYEYPALEVTVYSQNQGLALKRAEYLANFLKKSALKNKNVYPVAKIGKEKSEFRIIEIIEDEN